MQTLAFISKLIPQHSRKNTESVPVTVAIYVISKLTFELIKHPSANIWVGWEEPDDLLFWSKQMHKVYLYWANLMWHHYFSDSHLLLEHQLLPRVLDSSNLVFTHNSFTKVMYQCKTCFISILPDSISMPSSLTVPNNRIWDSSPGLRVWRLGVQRLLVHKL